MDPVAKEKWVAGLRSGKYKKAKYAYKKFDADGNICHCALGVLMEEVFPDRFMGYATLGLNNLLDSIGVSMLQKTDIVQLNDAMDASFIAIADYIETSF